MWGIGGGDEGKESRAEERGGEIEKSRGWSEGGSVKDKEDGSRRLTEDDSEWMRDRELHDMRFGVTVIEQSTRDLCRQNYLLQCGVESINRFIKA